jgi:hypothetical protein
VAGQAIHDQRGLHGSCGRWMEIWRPVAAVSSTFVSRSPAERKRAGGTAYWRLAGAWRRVGEVVALC